MPILIRGALAGFLATGPMTIMMKRLFRLLPRRERQMPPEQLTRELENGAGVRLSREEHRRLTNLAHYGFGAAAGALYAVSLRRWRAPFFIKGPVFGLAVWATSYMGWIPALDLAPAARNEPPRRNGVMIAAHLLWGAAMAELTERSVRDNVGILQRFMRGGLLTA